MFRSHKKDHKEDEYSHSTQVINVIGKTNDVESISIKIDKLVLIIIILFNIINISKYLLIGLQKKTKY